MVSLRQHHNRGDVNWGGCSKACFEQGDFFGLDDIATENEEVVDGFAQVFGEWITQFKFDGFRVDTAKHVDRDFFRRWVPRILETAKKSGINEFEIFGEVFLTDAIEQSAYIREWGLPNQLDFPFYDVASSYAGGSSGAGASSYDLPMTIMLEQQMESLQLRQRSLAIMMLVEPHSLLKVKRVQMDKNY